MISLIAVLNQTNGENGTSAGQFHGHNVNAKLCPEGLEMAKNFFRLFIKLSYYRKDIF